MTLHKVLQGDFSLQDDQRPYDPEVGGSLLSPGTYKSSYWSQGRLSLRPRLGLITGRTKAHSLVPILWSLRRQFGLLRHQHDGRNDCHNSGWGYGHATPRSRRSPARPAMMRSSSPAPVARSSSVRISATTRRPTRSGWRCASSRRPPPATSARRSTTAGWPA